jgi:hypothetical protein
MFRLALLGAAILLAAAAVLAATADAGTMTLGL